MSMIDTLTRDPAAGCEPSAGPRWHGTPEHRRRGDPLNRRLRSAVLIARRLEEIEKTLGFALAEPIGLTRARLALTAWRPLDD
jgi:hypothetical protein